MSSSDTLYLSKLKFDPQLQKSWLSFFVNNFRVVFLMILLIVISGSYAFYKLPRELNPEVKIPVAVIITTYPGVSPSDMEELITKKIENSISSIKGIKKITSTSANSISNISVEFEAGSDLDNSIRSLRDQIENIKKDLPSDANEPIVREVSFDDRPIWSFSLVGPYDGFTLRKYGDKLKDELEKVSGIREIKISGGDEKEFEIAYDPYKLLTYGITIDQVHQIIKSINISIPAGVFEGSKYNYTIRGDGRIYDVNSIANIPIFSDTNANVVYIKDIAKVQEKAIKKTTISRVSIDGQIPQSSINFDIIKKTGKSIIQTIDEGKVIADNVSKNFPSDIKIIDNVDYSKRIREQFNRLQHDFIFTILLVGVILFLLVGLKEAFVAGLSIPLSFCITFIAMDINDLSLNFLSVFALLLSLGLLVDDAIVVVSATKQYLKTGRFTPEQAILLVLNDFKYVLTTTTLTTVWAFLPLALASGIMGEFLKSITITVTVALLASLFVALTINHPLAAVLERVRITRSIFFIFIISIFAILIISFNLQNVILKYVLVFILFIIILFCIYMYRKRWKKILIENEKLIDMEWRDDELIKKKLLNQGSDGDNWYNKILHGIININKVLPLYERILIYLSKTKKMRIISLLFIFILFLSAVYLPISGILKSEFFPSSNGDLIFINVELPSGYNINETEKIVSQIEEKLIKYKDIVSFATVIGRPGIDLSRVSYSSNDSSNTAGITINLISKDVRKIKSYELESIIRDDLSSIKDATIKVSTPRGGPPSGSPFEARIIGDNLQTLEQIAKDLKKYLDDIPGINSSSISLKESQPEYTFFIDPIKAQIYNVNVGYISMFLRSAISGIEVSKVVKEGDEIKIIARINRDMITNLSDIQNLQIVNIKKQPVFLKDIAEIKLVPSVDSITRIDQKRSVLLSANVDKNISSTEIVKTFQNNIKDYKLPSGYNIIYGGENETNTESVKSIIMGMFLTLILILATMVTQFNSFKKAFIVIMTIPLSLIGVFYGLTILGLNLSFPGLIGILALFGIVVKNAIILVDKINLNIKSGIKFYDAIIDACKSRLEAIFITSISTIVGIIPITLSDETWRALGSAIICGLSVSSFFTLFVVPILFISLIKDESKYQS